MISSKHLSLRELLPEAELVEVGGSKCDLDVIDHSMQALHLGLQTQHVLKAKFKQTM